MVAVRLGRNAPPTPHLIVSFFRKEDNGCMNSSEPQVQAVMNAANQERLQSGGTPNTTNFGDLKSTGSTTTSVFNQQNPPVDYTGIAIFGGIVVTALIIAFMAGKLKERIAE